MRPNSETHFVGALVVVAEPPHDLFELGQGDLVEEDERYEWEDVLDEEGQQGVDGEVDGLTEVGEGPEGARVGSGCQHGYSEIDGRYDGDGQREADQQIGLKRKISAVLLNNLVKQASA